MKKLLFLLLNLVLVCQVYSVDYQAEFGRYYFDRDTVNQGMILEDWKINSPDDPDWYTSQFIYCFKKAMIHGSLVSVETVKRKFLSVNSDDFITVKYISGPDAEYDVPLVKIVVAEISEGIKKYPNRLDMRMRKLFSPGKLKAKEK